MLRGAPFIAFVPVSDVEQARGFYHGLLGLPVIEDTPFALVVTAGDTMLRITPVGEFRPQPFTVAGWQVPDIAEAMAALAERGLTGLRFDGMDQDASGVWTAPGGDRVAWFADPDGNTLSLTTFAAR
jgi:catechol 2,3-dioxygenase-like lactoylglutathione lyase family enzyme